MNTQPNAEFSIRPATKADVADILQLIRGLAEYEKLAHEVVADEETLERTLFGERPYAEVLLAHSGGKAAGLCLFFHSFSTFIGKPGIYLEDLFVLPEFRGLGIGKQFFAELSSIAQQRDCGRIEWSVLDWNEDAIAFYKGMGAEAMEEWTVHRLKQEQFETLRRSA